MISKILVESFPNVINESFTAEVENILDDVENDTVVWNDMIANFFGPFKKRVDEVMETQEKIVFNIFLLNIVYLKFINNIFLMLFIKP